MFGLYNPPWMCFFVHHYCSYTLLLRSCRYTHVRITMFLHLCFVLVFTSLFLCPCFYALVLRTCFTPLFYALVLRPCFTPLFYALVLRPCFTPLFYAKNAEKVHRCPQLYAFAVTTIQDCLQAVDTVFSRCRTECRQSCMVVEAIANKRTSMNFFVCLST